MAKDKKSFVLYADLIHTVRKMPEDKAGKLLLTILEYVNDENPIVDDMVVDLVFEPIKQQLKRDLIKFEHKKKQWSEAGRRSAEVRKAKKVQRTLTDVQGRSTDLTVNVNDNVNVNVSNNIINPKSKIDFGDLLDFINSKLGKKYRIINESVKKKYKARLKEGYTKEDIMSAIKNASNSDFHKENNFQYLTPEFFSRPITLDKYMGISTKKQTLRDKYKLGSIT